MCSFSQIKDHNEISPSNSIIDSKENLKNLLRDVRLVTIIGAEVINA